MKYLSPLTSLAVLLVALSAFTLAFFNVMGLAIENGIEPSRAWLVPIIIEGAIVALALTRLEAEINGRKTHWQTVLIVTFVAVAIALNIAHSNGEGWGMFIAGLQPVSLLVAFEAFMYQLRHRIARQQQTAVSPWRGRAKALIVIARQLQQCHIDAQAESRQLQTSVKDLQAQNNKLFEANKNLQQLNKRWQAIGNEAQTIIRLNAGEINEQQAVDMSGLDVRTVRTWSGRLNGVSK